MGDLGSGEVAEKLFDGIPTDADGVSIHFDIYQIVTWADDTIKVQVDRTTTIDLGRFNKGAYSTSVDGVVWWRSPLRNGSCINKVHHTSIKVPTALYKDGSIRLKIFGNFGTEEEVTRYGDLVETGGTFGIDNVEVVADYACTCTAPTTIVMEEDF